MPATFPFEHKNDIVIAAPAEDRFDYVTNPKVMAGMAAVVASYRLREPADALRRHLSRALEHALQVASTSTGW